MFSWVGNYFSCTALVLLEEWFSLGENDGEEFKK